jgi:hypothetical protein
MSEDLDPREVGLLSENQALLDHLVRHLAISPQTHKYLVDHWGQTNLLLEAARADGQLRRRTVCTDLREAIAKIVDPIAFGTYPDDAPDPRYPTATWSTTRYAMRARADGILALFGPGAAWQLVPREPTSEMLATAQIIHNRSEGHPTARWTWQAMLDVAPLVSGDVSGDRPQAG